METCPDCGMLAHQNVPCPGRNANSLLSRTILQGRYEILGLLREGGMGTVHMARDVRLHNRPCVVKKLRDDIYREEDKQKAVTLFLREVGVLSNLQHPNIVRILDYFEENYGYFLVMEYVGGHDLEAKLSAAGMPFSESQVIDWSLQILDVLQYLHGHQPPVIYRDLKPSNIILDDKGQIKLVDFGIARPIEEGSENTHVVSAGYSPPEQYWGSADARSDIYGLGTTMYYLLTGHDPVALQPSAPKLKISAISDDVNNIVKRATAQHPDDRYQSAAEMRGALLAGQTIMQPASQFKPKKGLLVATIAAILACALFFAYSKFQSLLELNVEQMKPAIKETLEHEHKRHAEKATTHSPLPDHRDFATEATEEAAAEISSEAQLTDDGH